MPKLTFVKKDGTRQVVDAPLKLSVMEIAKLFTLDMEGACEGCLACATCHVIVDPAWAGRLPPPGDDEMDLLELVFGLQETSRLACQIEMTPALDGLVVSLPRGKVPSLLLD